MSGEGSACSTSAVAALAIQRRIGDSAPRRLQLSGPGMDGALLPVSTAPLTTLFLAAQFGHRIMPWAGLPYRSFPPLV